MQGGREFFTAGDLRRRGWTEKLIRELAGPADQLAVNPHHPGGPGMRLYRSERIAEIELTDAFIQARAAAERRQAAAQKALKTKAANAAASAAGTIPAPVLPAVPREELIAAAVRWYNQVETWRAGAGRWLSTSDPGDLLHPIVIDFIRDRLSEYRRRARPIGVPISTAEAAVDQKILEAIAAAYPWLHGECEPRGQMTVDAKRRVI